MNTFTDVNLKENKNKAHPDVVIHGVVGNVWSLTMCRVEVWLL